MAYDRQRVVAFLRRLGYAQEPGLNERAIMRPGGDEALLGRGEVVGCFAPRCENLTSEVTGSLPDRVLYGRRTVSVVARTLPDRHDPCLSVRPGTKTVRPRARRPGARSPLWL